MNREIKELLRKLAELPGGDRLEKKLRDVSLMALQCMIERSQARRIDANTPESPHLASLLQQFAEARAEAEKLIPEFAAHLPKEDGLAVVEVSKAVVFDK